MKINFPSTLPVSSLLIAAFVLTFHTSSASVLRVKSGALGAADGSSWVNAYPNLQDALATATAGDNLWVAAGTYNPDQGAGVTTGDRSASFLMKDGVKIFGGFAGTETSFTQRDIDTHETILSGDLLGDDPLTGDNWKTAALNLSDNSYRVVKALAGVSSTASLNGLTIRSGNSIGIATLDSFGGGLFIEQSSPVIKLCRFEQNRAGRGGAVSVKGNQGAQEALFTRCVFLKNYALYGGALHVSSSSPEVHHCQFDESQTSSGTTGGIVSIIGVSAPKFYHSLFQGGYSASGGAFHVDSTLQPELINCTIRENSADRGGAIYSEGSAVMILKNTLIWGNTDTVANSTTTPNASVAYASGTPPLEYSHCLVQNYDLSAVGTNNLDGTDSGNDPLFVSAVAELDASSPVIDQADNTAVSAVEDLLGNHRIRNATIDLGATEYQPSRIVHVDLNATGANNGKRWSDAYTDLRAALFAAAAGDEFWVAAGIYYPDASSQTFDFHISRVISIYGGFQGTEQFRSDRDPQAHRVVLSGDIDQNDTTNAQGVVTDPANIVGDNSRRIVFVDVGFAPPGTVVIDGLTITGANGIASALKYGGITIGVSPGDVVLNQCVIRGNSGNSGGGVYVATGNLTMSHCQLWNNHSLDDGGGMYFTSFGELTVKDTVIQENDSIDDGGGIWSASSSPASIQRCIFRGNESDDEGGAIYISAASLQLDDSVFSGNSGGALYLQLSNDTQILNCTFQGNHWVTANPSAGGALTVIDSTVNMTNTIIWGNALNNVTTSAEASVFYSNSTGTTQHCLLQNINPAGTGNLDGTNALNAPLFVNGTNPLSAPLLTGDLHLQSGSPGIDWGNNSANTHITDIDGNARIFNSIIDFGAYEFGSSPPINTFALTFPSLDPNGDENGNGYSNYLEYASGYNPTTSDYAPPLFEDGMITFTQRVGAIDVFVKWEKSSDLMPGSWTTMQEGVDYTLFSTGATLVQTSATLDLLLTPPGTSHIFVRQAFSSSAP